MSCYRGALHRGRDAAGGLGQPEELPAEGGGGRPSDGDPSSPSVNFHGEKRANETHQSKSDPQALLARKAQGRESKLAATTGTC